jgi:uncharacterized protein YukE
MQTVRTPARQVGFRITPTVREEIVKIVDARVRETHVTREDFSELKGIVAELAQAQKRTEQRVEELAQAQKRTEQRVEELAEAQKQSEVRLTRLEAVVEELAQAQKRTESALMRLAEEVRTLARGLDDTRRDLGGLARSVSYGFENEAFRALPGVLRERYGIAFKEKIVRAEIGGKEINLFGKAERNGSEVFVVGEAKLRLDGKRQKEEKDVFDELQEKAQAVWDELGKAQVVKILVTHFATKEFLRKAEDQGVIVVQSFEW